ncbi:MAG: glycosyltransferase [Oscillospiraceae bacterium]
MKILILTCNTGEGHNSTAAAIQEEFLRRGVACETADALAFLSPRISSLVCGAHVMIYRKVPQVFSAGYRMEEKHVSKRLFHMLFSETDELEAYIRRGQFDAVICAHVFPGLMMTNLRRTGRLTIPQFFVATDYTCSPGTGQMLMDAWFIPQQELTEEFASCGIPRERIVVSGIPVRSCFLQREDRGEARRALGLPEEGRMALLCCGSMGCGPMQKLAADLSAELPEDAFLTVVCGTNERLREALEERGLARVFVVGFTREMERYMDAADLYLTKAGGLSTTEALMKGLPLLYVDAVGGCETRNRDFMLLHGFALGAESNRELPALAADCLRHPEKLEETIRRREGAFCRRAASEVAETVRGCVLHPDELMEDETAAEKKHGRVRRWRAGMKL